ncbi:MAG: Maf family protein [Gammaproteobacteria bacterium]
MDNSLPNAELAVELILASSSPYRGALLSRLGLRFAQYTPDDDERPGPSESASALVERLAIAKARAAVPDHPEGLIIGSDQVCVVNDAIVGKPGNHARAIEQLERASGNAVRFLTGLCLLNARTEAIHSDVVPFTVHFRALPRAQIEAYLERERPYDCAGSFRSEGLGIALIERLEGEDPNALVGLPLIRLVEMLADEGIDVLQP